MRSHSRRIGEVVAVSDTERIPEGALNVLDYSLWRLPADASRGVVLADLRGEFPEEWMVEPTPTPEDESDQPVRFCTACESTDRMGPRCVWCGSEKVVSADEVRELKRQANGVSSP